MPDEVIELEQKVRDVNDRPILRSAVSANADIPLTGDNDFLEAGLQHPRTVNAAEFLEYNYHRL